MFFRIHFLFLFLLSGVSSFSLLAQQKVKIEIMDEQNQIKYAGSFDFSITSKRLVAKNNNQYSIVFEEGDKEKFISIFISNLKWSKGTGDLVLKKYWISDNANLFKPLNACIPIQVGGKGAMEFNVLKNGTTKLTIPYAVVPKNTNCNTVELNTFNKGTFTIQIDVKGITSTSKEGAASQEELTWNNCVEKRSSVVCLKDYLHKFPNGKHVSKAKQQINYIAVNDHFPKIVKLNRSGQEELLKQSCEDFLTLFPSFVDPYRSVKVILEKVNQEMLLAKQKELSTGMPPVTNHYQIPVETHDSIPDESQSVTSNTNRKAVNNKAEKSPEDLAWEQAIADNNHPCKAFKAYLSNDKYEKYREEAEKEIASRCNIEVSKTSQNGNQYTFRIDNVIALNIDSIVPEIDSAAWKLQKLSNQYACEFVIDFPEANNYVIYFSDQYFEDHIRLGLIPIGNLLDPEVLFSGDSILFTFKKGTAPFTVYFQQEGGIVSFDTITDHNELLLRQSFLKNEKKLSGKYSVLVSDKVLNVPYTEVDWTINIIQEIQPMKYLIAIGCILLIALFFVYKRYQNKKRKEKKEKLDSVMKANKQNMTVSPKRKNKDLTWKTQDQINIQSKTSYSAGTDSVERRIKKKSEIKITGLRRSSKKVFHYQDESELLPIIKESVFSFEPHLLWPDSVIESIHFTKKSILTLDHFLVTQNLKLLQENAESIPEIGGILVGLPGLSAIDGKYRIMVQEFVPINAEFHSVFQLEFSTESLAKDLGNIQDQFPEYIAVGWFHTHPGHGLFLSKPDLTIQERFFGEPYQFAMEIDSLSEKLDTAIFTRTKDGVINNTNSKLESSNWFSWMENVTSLNQQ